MIKWKKGYEEREEREKRSSGGCIGNGIDCGERSCFNGRHAQSGKTPYCGWLQKIHVSLLLLYGFPSYSAEQVGGGVETENFLHIRIGTS